MNGVNLTAASQLSGADGIPICPPVPPIDGDEDAQTIYRLENECYKLRVSMSKVRKATQEWFFLETRLKNATDELDAAKEDRDLMLGGGDVCFGTEIDAIANNKATNNNNDSSNNNTCSAGPLVVPLTPIKSEAQKQREKIEQDLQRIEVQLNVHPKFSPEWFKLKEELVELRIKLDEGDSTKNKSNSSSNNINNGSSSNNNNNNNKITTPSKKQNKENFNENNWDEVQVELPPQFHFRPISPPPSPSSPSTSTSSLSRSRIVNPTPGKPHTSTPGSGSFYYNFYSDDQDTIEQRTLLRSQHDAACEELDKFPQFSKEWFAAKTKAVLLEDQLEELENKSHSHHSCGGSNRSFSGWSENEEELEAISCADELECVMVAEALKQGNCISPSFVGDDDLQEDEGGLDNEDNQLQGDVEGVDNVGIALTISTEDQSDENQTAMLLRPRQLPFLFNAGEDSQKDGEKAAIESDHQLQEDVLKVGVEDIGAVSPSQDLPGDNNSPKQQEEDASPEDFPLATDSDQPTNTEAGVPDEAVPLESQEETDTNAIDLGKVDNDQLEIQKHHVVMIQEQWRIHSRCSPFKRTKTRALVYQTVSRDESHSKKGKGFNLVGFVQNLLPKDKHSRWSIFAAVLIQSRWRSYQKRKLFKARISSITKVQALARCKQQQLMFCKQREKASTLRKRPENKELASLLDESENVLEDLKALQAAIIVQRAWKRHHSKSQKSLELRSILEQASYMRMQLAMLKGSITIQRRWRAYIEQKHMSELYEKHDALSEKLDNLTKYSREWCDIVDQMRALRDQIGQLETTDPHHNQERDDTAPCIETESVNFASIRDSLEKKATVSTPKLPDNHWNEKFQKGAVSSSTPVAPKGALPKSGNVSVSQYRETFEGNPNAAEKPPTPKTKKSRTRKSPKKSPTLKDLGIECLRLSQRLNDLPKFSPEWTLSKVELKLVTEEMEYLYLESLQKGT